LKIIFKGSFNVLWTNLWHNSGQKDGSGRWPTEHMFEMFSNLSERADVEASVLSAAGEQ
jgi:branched-chain amino acid transport system ATP-binding protein